MKNVLVLLLGITALAACSPHLVPEASTGKLVHLKDFPAENVSPRHVDIWLPDEYSQDKRYPVLYMHDGQNLYDTTVAYMGSEWGVDETLSSLADTTDIQPPIVVGVWNSGRTRPFDYMPQKPAESLTRKEVKQAKAGLGWLKSFMYNFYSYHADDYLKFLTKELKPYIDKHYATRPGRAHNFIAGSSMGGLISWYALCEYPEVFGGAACLSTHWPGTYNPDNPLPQAFIRYLDNHLPPPGNHRIYFDHGTTSLDSMYAPYQKRVDSLMQEKGYGPENRKTLKFEGAGHTNDAWRKRLHIPLWFLLHKNAGQQKE